MTTVLSANSFQVKTVLSNRELSYRYPGTAKQLINIIKHAKQMLDQRVGCSMLWTPLHEQYLPLHEKLLLHEDMHSSITRGI